MAMGGFPGGQRRNSASGALARKKSMCLLSIMAPPTPSSRVRFSMTLEASSRSSCCLPVPSVKSGRTWPAI